MIQSLLSLFIFIVITIIYLRVKFHKHQAWSSSLVLESSPPSNFSWCYFNKSNNGLVFIKTHKTSSSTLSRLIVINLCERKGRKCFLPSFDNPGRTWDLRKERDYKYASKEAPYEVWANHVIAPQLVRKLMVSKSFFISICRDPSLRFRSAYNWYRLDKQLGKSLSQFIEILNHTAVGSASHQYALKYRTGLDSVSEELMGLEESRSGSETGPSFSLLLKKILTSQYYILVSDRFDESLLILGQFLGLEVSDLIYKKQKVTPIEQLIVLSEAQREVLVRHQPQDSALFKAANNMLDFYISHYPGGSIAFRTNLVDFRFNLVQMETICERIKVENISNNSSLLYSSPNNRDSNIEKSNKTTDLTTQLYCNSLQRDNDEAVRHEWQKVMKLDKSLLKKALFV